MRRSPARARDAVEGATRAALATSRRVTGAVAGRRRRGRWARRFLEAGMKAPLSIAEGARTGGRRTRRLTSREPRGYRCASVCTIDSKHGPIARPEPSRAIADDGEEDFLMGEILG